MLVYVESSKKVLRIDNTRYRFHGFEPHDFTFRKIPSFLHSESCVRNKFEISEQPAARSFDCDIAQGIKGIKESFSSIKRL